MMDHERYNKGIFRHTSYLKINMTYDVHYKNRPKLVSVVKYFSIEIELGF